MHNHSWIKFPYAQLEYQKGNREIILTQVKDFEVCSKCGKIKYVVLFSEGKLDKLKRNMI